jgi:hypothetical protein
VLTKEETQVVEFDPEPGILCTDCYCEEVHEHDLYLWDYGLDVEEE